MPFVLYNSRDPHFKQPFGALEAGQSAEFHLHLPKNDLYLNPCLLLFAADRWDSPTEVPLRYKRAELSYNDYACVVSLPQPGLFFYTFEAGRGSGRKRLTRLPDGSGEFSDRPGALWQLTVYAAGLDTPAFMKGGIMYQIFPDRFCNSGSPRADVPADRRLHADWHEMPDFRPDANGKITNSDYFGGDLRGIHSKLDYLSELGVTCIYLNPIFEAHSNHRYNTADYRCVDPLLGTEDDLRGLCADARALGIRVILDGVFSHTGDDSIYFNRQGRYPDEGAFQSTGSRYYPWYEFQHWPDRYSSWWGFETLPNVIETNPDYIQFICGEGGVLEYWLSLGVSGFRLDVADELPDAFLDALTMCVKRYDPQALVLGEVWEDASNKVAYSKRRRYLLGGQLDSVMNYPFRDGILDFIREGHAEELNNTVLTILENYPAPVAQVLMNPLSTHDVERAITRLVGEPLEQHDREWQMQHHTLGGHDYRFGQRLLELAMVLQFFLPGVPCIYYGDEVGLSGYRDPFNRCTFPWDGGDSELLAFTRRLGSLRSEYRAFLASASFVPLSFDQNVFAFARVHESHALIVAVNRGGAAVSSRLPCEPVMLLGEYTNGIFPALSFLIGACDWPPA